MTARYEGIFRFTKVVDSEGTDVPIPTVAKPNLTLVDSSGNPMPMPVTQLGPYELRLTAMEEENGNTYNLRTKIINSMGGPVVISKSADGQDVMIIKFWSKTQVASRDPYCVRLEQTVLAIFRKNPIRVSLEGDELILQGSDGSTFHGARVME